jgi:hypothetical protein
MKVSRDGSHILPNGVTALHPDDATGERLVSKQKIKPKPKSPLVRPNNSTAWSCDNDIWFHTCFTQISPSTALLNPEEAPLLHSSSHTFWALWIFFGIISLPTFCPLFNIYLVLLSLTSLWYIRSVLFLNQTTSRHGFAQENHKGD